MARISFTVCQAGQARRVLFTIATVAMNQRRGHAAVGGVLVLTRQALWFVPHLLNAKPYRQPVRIPLGEIEDLEIVARSRMEIWFTGNRSDLFPGRLKVT